MAEFNLIGVHRIIPTRKSLAIAAAYHKYTWLINGNGEYVEEINWDNFENLGLFEMQVFGEYLSTDLLTIHQNDQSPYMEFYLDPTGVEYLEEQYAVKTNGRRVCFFLHFINISSQIEIGDQKIELPPFTQLPDRLVPFAHYVPTD